MRTFTYQLLELVLLHIRNRHNSSLFNNPASGFCILILRMRTKGIISIANSGLLLNVIYTYKQILLDKIETGSPISKTDSEAIEGLRNDVYLYNKGDWDSREKFLVALIKRYKRIEILRNESNKL